MQTVTSATGERGADLKIHCANAGVCVEILAGVRLVAHGPLVEQAVRQSRRRLIIIQRLLALRMWKPNLVPSQQNLLSEVNCTCEDLVEDAGHKAGNL